MGSPWPICTPIRYGAFWQCGQSSLDCTGFVCREPPLNVIRVPGPQHVGIECHPRTAEAHDALARHSPESLPACFYDGPFAGRSPDSEPDVVAFAFTKVPLRRSRSASSISSRVFITNGPYRAMGSCRGCPETSRNRPG